MIREMDYAQDDKTVILNRHGDAPAHSPLTDFSAPPKFEQLEEPMIYAARLRSAETFIISLNRYRRSGGHHTLGKRERMVADEPAIELPQRDLWR